VRDQKLLSIGSFSVLAGLSVPTLRHYDEVGVLKPAAVDDRTGYRSYHPDQIHLGRTIRALRAVDLPIDELRDVVESDDPEYLRGVLTDHLERMEQRATTLSQQIEALAQFIEEGVIVPEPKGSRIAMINVRVKDLAESRRFYEDVFDAHFSNEDHEGESEKHLQASFGTWGQDNFFLIQLWEAPEGHYGLTDIGFLVDDVDAAYKRALAAGAKDDHAPKDMPGMPRVAQVWDPSGNAIGLYQDQA
jgi:DNA-binding transcriptional MerR regulator